MVICTYFLNNMCRFGPKCNNEHVNVKLTLKTDAEHSMMGKQWPLSCYGPFRDKPCIPNFIEDQSFEEARFQCYEAKASGNVPAVTQQFTQRATDARNKMSMLMNPSDEVATLVTNLYNSHSTTTNTVGTTGSNPFDMNTNSNAMSAGNIFGGNTATTGNTNLFGSSTTSSNPFSRSTSAFGAPAQSQASTNLFGRPTTTQSSLFGGSSTTTPSNNLFGGSSFSNTNSSGGSIFGGGGGGQTNSVFGSNTAASGPFQQTNNSSPFAMPQTNTNSFFQNSSQIQNQNPTFGGAPSFGNQKTGLFAQASTVLGQQTNNGNIFGQSVQSQGFGALNTNAQQTTQSQSIFGGQTQTMQAQSNPFGGATTNSIFATPQQQQQQQQQQQTQPQPSLFQSSTNSFSNSNAMNPSSQSIFGQTPQTQTTPFNQVPAAAAAAATAPTSNLQQQQQSIFGTSSFANPPQQTAPPAFGVNLFQQSQGQPIQSQTQQIQPQQQIQSQPNMPFGQVPQNTFAAAGQTSVTLYTPMEALSADEIEAFRSDSFDITKIPTKPPPMELCR